MFLYDAGDAEEDRARHEPVSRVIRVGGAEVVVTIPPAYASEST